MTLAASAAGKVRRDELRACVGRVMIRVEPTVRKPRANVRGESTRTKLLNAALASFAQRGFHGTSTRDIAEAANMSPAVVYAHYESKEDLLYRLSVDGHLAVRELVARSTSSDESPDRRLYEAAREFASWHARFHTQARVLQYEMAALGEAHSKEISAIRRETEACFKQVVQAGCDAGMFEVTDPAISALAILSLGIDVARWYRPGGAWSPDDIGAQYGELALRMVGYRTP